MSVLRVDHLSCSFGNLVVTNDVSLSIADGERHVIIGPNGAGKTSLINQIGGQLRPNAMRRRPPPVGTSDRMTTRGRAG